jgi:hypothetical protein
MLPIGATERFATRNVRIRASFRRNGNGLRKGTIQFFAKPMPQFDAVRQDIFLVAAGRAIAGSPDREWSKGGWASEERLDHRSSLPSPSPVSIAISPNNVTERHFLSVPGGGICQKMASKGALDARTKIELCSSSVLYQEGFMFRTVVEEAAALASITLFLGMIAIWAQIIARL